MAKLNRVWCLWASILAVGMVGCGTSGGGRSDSEHMDSTAVVFDVFNGGQGRNAEMPTPARVTALASALATLPSDIVCLNGYPWDSERRRF